MLRILPDRCASLLRLAVPLAGACAVGLAAACATGKEVVYSLEKFDTMSRHARTFGLSAAQTCEAARRALLGHGYLVQRFSADLVDGRKSFQPSDAVHVEIEFHVVCASEGADRSTVYVNALQDRYALKKITTSASLGVGPFGSVSVPFGSSSDSLVKIASETIPAGEFYERFFALIEHQLAQLEPDPADDPAHVILPALVTAPPASGSTPAQSPAQLPMKPLPDGDPPGAHRSPIN